MRQEEKCSHRYTSAKGNRKNKSKEKTILHIRHQHTLEDKSSKLLKLEINVLGVFDKVWRDKVVEML